MKNKIKIGRFIIQFIPPKIIYKFKNNKHDKSKRKTN
jgi:hypothetical protein